MVEVKPHEGVARLEASQENGHVGLCAGVRLHVGPFRTEELLHAVNGNLFALVNDLAAAIVALARKTFGIFVGHYGTHGFHHLRAHEIFRSNQLDAFGLAIAFLLNQIKNNIVSLHFLNVLI